ncbi:MAG TPA: amidohydrolase family protein [Ktedonobacterales bacterium]|nr:amidohydrolase family protein [Ktedonobacterales bacterium]
MPQVDLSEITVLDQHCHPFTRQWFRTNVPSFRACFTEGRLPVESFVPSLVYYRWAQREMRRALNLAPDADEETILAARTARADDYLATMMGETLLEGLLLDDGYPPTGEALNVAQMGEACGCPSWRILRLETLLESLLLRSASLDDVLAAFTVELGDLRARGVVALKSIIAYRGGLAVLEPSLEEAREAFTTARAMIAREGRVRLAGPEARALLHYFIYRALEQAAKQELAIQFHTGFGDTDQDLLTSNPALLRPLIQSSQDNSLYRGARIVLLHASYPYTREAAYLASVYPHVFVDVSLANPFLAGMVPSIWRELLAMAPATKILYGSDSSVIPEHIWLGALLGRRSLGTALGELIDAGLLSTSEALDAAETILNGVAHVLYGV